MIKMLLKANILKLASKNFFVLFFVLLSHLSRIWYLTKYIYKKKNKGHSKTIKIPLKAKKLKNDA
jgi:hypothetical protein